MQRIDPPEILGAAIRLADGKIFYSAPPARHPSIILLCQNQGASLVGSTQGFLTTDGDFVDRKEAWTVAERAGQLLPVPHQVGTLYSEDVW
jgi:hypothetical protein